MDALFSEIRERRGNIQFVALKIYKDVLKKVIDLMQL